MEHTIRYIKGREVLDSRGNPTLEVEMGFESGGWGRAIVPSGASTGEHEALELRDGDRARYLGKGVLKAVETVNGPLRDLLLGNTFSRQDQLDGVLLERDPSPQKSQLGGNTVLGLSLAFAHAVADARKLPLYRVMNESMGLDEKAMTLPVPLMNIINGGLHANNPLEIQEFMIVPHGFPTFPDALRAGTEIFHHLKKQLSSAGQSTAVGDEGGFAPNLSSDEAALQAICGAVESAGYQLREQVSIALDAAASSFYDRNTGRYRIAANGAKDTDREGLIELYARWLDKYPIVSLEDGLDENDWEGWQKLTEKLGARIQLVGDDLFVTQPSFVRKGIERQAANAVLIKVNQVGSLTETYETLRLCRENGYGAVISHRSGETEDVTIAHLAVACGCGQIKTGSLSRSERLAKYNELLRIGDSAASVGEEIPFARRF